MADSFQALGVWELPLGGATERRGSYVSDREAVVGEVLIGDRYGRFMYYDLDRLRRDDLLRVSAAADLLRNLPAH